MKTQLDEKQELLCKLERLDSPEEVRQVAAYIAGLEAGKAIGKAERDRAS